MEVATLYASRGANPVLSAETFPTENFRPIDAILNAAEALVAGGIGVITTTWGALGSARGGTTAISRILHQRLGVPTVVHLSIQGKTRHDLENILRGMHLEGLHNVLALGGDPPNGRVDPVAEDLRHAHACDLVAQIVALNDGLWLDADERQRTAGVKTRFGIGVAGFPEVHPDDWRAGDSADINLGRAVRQVKWKADAGAQYVVGQMVFDAGLHFAFVDRARAAGITLPMIPGVLAFDRWSEIARFVGDKFRISMPRTLRAALETGTDDQRQAAAERHMAQLVRSLLDGGAPGIHFYCMNKSAPTLRILQQALR